MNRQLQVCVLGGTGFIGTHLVSRLASAGHTVRVLSRRPYRNRTLAVLPTVRVEQADVHDGEALTRAFRGCDAVVNLVGILNETRGQSFRLVHVELPRKVAQACRAAGVGRLLHMSALNADAGNAPSRYLRSKGEGEAALRVHAANQVHCTVFQPSTVFGPGDSFLNRFSTLLRLSPGVFPLACPDARFQPVFVGDVAEAFAVALDDRSTFGRRYTLCGPTVYTLREIIEMIAEQTGRRRAIIGLPPMLARLQATLLEFFPGKPFTRDVWRSLQVDSVCGAGPGLSQLGITASALEPSLVGQFEPASAGAAS